MDGHLADAFVSASGVCTTIDGAISSFSAVLGYALRSPHASIPPTRVGRDPRTIKTHRTRIEAYIYPHLSGGKERRLTHITFESPRSSSAQGLPRCGARTLDVVQVGAGRERRWVPPEETGRFLEAVDPRHWALVLTPFLTGVRPEELLALRRQDIDKDRQLILVHQRVTPHGGRPDKTGVLKPGLK